MSFIVIDRVNLDSVRDGFYEGSGYFPVTLEQLEEHPLFDEINKLLNAIDPEFNQDSVFSVKADNGISSALYTFSLVNDGGKAVVQFGVDVDSENKKNVVPVKAVKEEQFGELVSTFKVGRVTIQFRKEGGSVRASLKLGRTETDCAVVLAPDITYEIINQCETEEQLASCLGNYGTFAVKLTDLVRIEFENGSKGSLKENIELEILSWKDPTFKDFGTRKAGTIVANINYKGVAKTEKGQIVNNPGAVYIPDSHLAYKLLTNTTSDGVDKKTGLPKTPWVAKASEEKLRGGKIVLIINSFNLHKDPETNKMRPGSVNGVLRIVPGNNPNKALLEARESLENPENWGKTKSSSNDEDLVKAVDLVKAGF